jgi:thymidine kinase
MKRTIGVLSDGHPQDSGFIEGKGGNMASGKSGWIIGIAHDPTNHQQGLIFIHPVQASRTATTIVRSRTYATYRNAVAVRSPREILRLVTADIRHVCIEEVHFFGRTTAMEEQFKHVILTMWRQGKHIYWTGLPLDFKGEPFEIVAWMMAMSDKYELLPGKCKRCGREPAHYSQRLMFGHPAPRNTPRFVPDTERYQRMGFTYEQRCGQCFIPPGQPNEYLQAILRLLRGKGRPALRGRGKRGAS